MTLYDDLGGGAAIEAALDLFYRKVMADPRVSRFFDGVDVATVKRKQKKFLAYAFGGPSGYEGRDLEAAHAGPRRRGLDEEAFDVFMAHFNATLAELEVPEEKIAEVMAIAYGGREDVLGRRPGAPGTEP